MKTIRKIAMIVPSISGGGAEKVAADLSLYFGNKGYKVIFFVRDMPICKGYACVGKVIPIPMTYNREPDFHKSLQTLQKEALYLKKAKEAYEIDISISFMQTSNLLNILSRAKDKVVVTLHSVVSERKECLDSIENKKKVLRYIYQLADKIIFVSKYCRKDWIRNYGDIFHKTQVIYNPIGSTRRKEKIEDKVYGERVIISIARFNSVKRPWHIVRMFSRVLMTYPDACLLMLGDGELLPFMQKLASEMGIESNIHFLGNVENIDDYLDIAKVFVLASASESFGCSVVEAMRQGVPIVANDCPGGIKEILRNKCGIITPYLYGNKYSANDPLSKEEISMANAVVQIFSDSSIYNKFTQTCKEKAEQFSLNHIGSIWEDKIFNENVKNMQIKKMIVVLLRGICGFAADLSVFDHNNEKHVPDNLSNKFENYFYILDKWMTLKETGKGVESYFLHKGYKRIAVYGLGKMGKHLIAELENSIVEVVYGIDQKAEYIYAGIPMLGLDDELQTVDVIVVTVTFDYENVKKKLCDKIKCPIVSLKEVIYDCV